MVECGLHVEVPLVLQMCSGWWRTALMDLVLGHGWQGSATSPSGLMASLHHVAVLGGSLA